MRRLVGIILPLSLVAGLAACGGGGSSSSSGSSSKSDSSSSGSDDAYSKLVEKGNNAKIRVTYKTADGTTYTISQDPPKRAYLSGDTAIYEDGKSSTICSNVGQSDVQCIKTDGGGAGLAGLGGAGALGTIAQVLQSSKNLPGVSKMPDRTIAGRSATCAKYSLPLFGKGSIESCVDKETGIALYVKTTGEGTSALDLVATEVGDPKASDFTPPAKAEDLNALIPTTTTM